MKRWSIVLGCFALLSGLWWGLWHPANRIQVVSPLIGHVVPTQIVAWWQASNEQASEEQVIFPEELYGHVTLVHFFASWCLYCRTEMPVWLDIAADRTLDIQRIGVAYKDQSDALTIFLNTYGNPFQAIVWDPMGKLGLAWGVYGTPETFLIGPQGEMLAKWVGPLSETLWANHIRPLIQQREQRI
ncbi:MAG: hypothetical protein A3J38_05955 [Gammaproteobacteria bacterium RIFCSPHIGHO2_12_FULL_45_9]|nr:MAG: hypothetical protein A3J38_05955 [Gammaproteobacteria bacterium RIFCSPHIGHO2_12_FULL_45_9]